MNPLSVVFILSELQHHAAEQKSWLPKMIASPISLRMSALTFDNQRLQPHRRA